nr:Chain C, Tat-Tl8 [synthetic construct]1ZVS_F Chain F, Tat-Tl8 [synthetic construct]
TTPESANL